MHTSALIIQISAATINPFGITGNMANNKSYYLNQRPEVTSFIPENYSKVLEIGCGEGGFRSNLNDECEYWGIEPFNDAYVNATKRLDKVLMGTYEEVFSQLPDNYFDLIICNDVIEHMIDHDKFLDSIKQKMCHDANMIGSIPNIRHAPILIELLFKKDWLYRDDGVLDRTHLRFFTLKSLTRTFLSHTYKIEELRGINRLGFKPTAIKRIIHFIFVTLFGSDTRYLQFGFRVKCNKM